MTLNELLDAIPEYDDTVTENVKVPHCVTAAEFKRVIRELAEPTLAEYDLDNIDVRHQT